MSGKEEQTNAQPRSASDSPAAGAESMPVPTMKSLPMPSSPEVTSGEIQVVSVPPTKPSPSATVEASKPFVPALPPPRSRLPSQPAAPKPTSLPVQTKRTPTLRDDNDVRSIFDVETNIPEIDPVSEDEAEAKRKAAAQRGSRPDQREVSRSRKIPVDEDLLRLSNDLFGGGSSNTPLVAPDISALALPGLTKDLSAPKPPPPAEAPLALEPDKPPPAPLFDMPTAALTSAPKPAAAPPKNDIDIDLPPLNPGLDKKRLAIGGAIVAVLAAGVFFFARGAGEKTETAEAGAETTSESRTGSNADARGNLDTAPNTQANLPSPSPGTTGASPTTTAKAATEPASDKRAVATTQDPGAKDPKAGSSDKPPEKDPGGKPAETAPAANNGAKAQSLAEAMAAGANGKTAPTATTPPPSSGGGESFSTGAASAALGAAAGRAASCKAPGDPSGVARVSVTFAPSGRATKATVNGPPFAGTPTGGCIAAAFRSASVPPFSGDPVTVNKSVTFR